MSTPDTDPTVAPKGFKITSLATDISKETEGVWITIDEDTGARIRVGRMGNTAYEEELARLTRPYGHRVRATGGLDAKLIQKLIRQAVASHVLRGWENMAGPTGALVPYTPATALAWFDKYPEFYRLVVGYASDVEAFREEAQGEILGNS